MYCAYAVIRNDEHHRNGFMYYSINWFPKGNKQLKMEAKARALESLQIARRRHERQQYYLVLMKGMVLDE